MSYLGRLEFFDLSFLPSTRAKLRTGESFLLTPLFLGLTKLTLLRRRMNAIFRLTPSGNGRPGSWAPKIIGVQELRGRLGHIEPWKA